MVIDGATELQHMIDEHVLQLGEAFPARFAFPQFHSELTVI
jgi:hypothetical protein